MPKPIKENKTRQKKTTGKNIDNEKDPITEENKIFDEAKRDS